MYQLWDRNVRRRKLQQQLLLYVNEITWYFSKSKTKFLFGEFRLPYQFRQARGSWSMFFSSCNSILCFGDMFPRFFEEKVKISLLDPSNFVIGWECFCIPRPVICLINKTVVERRVCETRNRSSIRIWRYFCDFFLSREKF